MNVDKLASEIGKTFAIIQWGAGIDEDNVEFVLGTSDRVISLYLLDFGQFQTLDLFKYTGTIYQAFKGAMVMGDNGSFIPKDPDLFLLFRTGYVDAADFILKEKGISDMFNAEAFMKEYEEYVEDLL
ncbi:hypothetical protein N7492_005643 [Penicillium capsulatum]|uniref:Uncharacterized protein n=1 Tax=Penicillium capsulatum TaxID=69766 RepID=A0A9W9LS39_9EURO|nr:hypothetical protein N7492_005643 [Penicillium capsulatum]KAJ6135260.1 hypothetical protein N7512_000420 [Penicillium capsulatum]